MGVLTALAILAGLIVVHEAGHFFAATWQGIRVSGFSVGFGPVLLEKQRRGVQFALRAIPLGGFVSFPDDDEDSAIPSDDPDLLSNRPLHQRALVIAAGVIANLLLAWAVLLAQGAFVGIPAGFSATPGVLVSGVLDEGASPVPRHEERTLAALLHRSERLLKLLLRAPTLEGGPEGAEELVRVPADAERLATEELPKEVLGRRPT